MQVGRRATQSAQRHCPPSVSGMVLMALQWIGTGEQRPGPVGSSATSGSVDEDYELKVMDSTLLTSVFICTMGTVQDSWDCCEEGMRSQV